MKLSLKNMLAQELHHTTIWNVRRVKGDVGETTPSRSVKHSANKAQEPQRNDDTACVSEQTLVEFFDPEDVIPSNMARLFIAVISSHVGYPYNTICDGWGTL
jgi:hypothetical protein